MLAKASEIIAGKVTQITEPAGDGRICHRAIDVRVFEHLFGPLQAQLFKECHGGLSPVDSEMMKNAPRTGCSRARQELNRNGLIPMSFDVLLHPAHLPGCRSARLTFVEQRIVQSKTRSSAWLAGQDFAVHR